MHHFVGQDSQRPPVGSLVVSSSFQNLGGQVLRSSAKGLGSLAISDNFGHTEVSQADISIIVHQDVFQLKVAVDEILRVEMSEPQSDLHGIKLGLLFRELLLVGKVLEQLSSLCIGGWLLMNCMMK